MLNPNYEIGNDVCLNCKGSSAVILDSENGETVCSLCGIVVRDRIESLGPEGESHSKDVWSRTGMPFSLALHDAGLSTTMARTNLDANGVKISAEQKNKVDRMRRCDKISERHDRNLKAAFNVLRIIGDKLALNEAVIERAAYNYRKALTQRMIKGRSIKAIVVASVYAACRESFVPRTLEEIAEAANSDTIFAGRCYRLLVRGLGLQLPAADLNKCLRRIANNAKISEKTFRRALEIMALVKENHVAQGKDPLSLSAAVMYAACLKEGERINQAQFAVAAGTSVVTLRKRLPDVLAFS